METSLSRHMCCPTSLPEFCLILPHSSHLPIPSAANPKALAYTWRSKPPAEAKERENNLKRVEGVLALRRGRHRERTLGGEGISLGEHASGAGEANRRCACKQERQD